MQQQAKTKQSSRQATCLIVDDSESDQQMMHRVICRAQSDMRVEVAASLTTARRTLQRTQVSLILLDNNLPDGIGANFALELAAVPELSKIPVILVSDWPSPFMWQKAASAGVLYVVKKADFGARYVHAALRNAHVPKAKMN